MEGHTDSVTSMIIDGNILITGSDDGTIRQWNLVQFTPAGKIGDHGEENAISSLVLIKESGLLISCAQDKTVKVWYTVNNILVDILTQEKPETKKRDDEDNGPQILPFSKYEEPLCLEYISEENTLLLGTESGNILTHDITDFIHFDFYEWKEENDRKRDEAEAIRNIPHDILMMMHEIDDMDKRIAEGYKPD